MSGEQYGVQNGWLFEYVDEHTCGTDKHGYHGMHEPGCGTIPIALVEDVLKEGPKMTTAESIEILAQFESWREDTLLAGPDVSLTAYIRVLEAAEPDPRIAEVHELAVAALDDPGARSIRDKDRFFAIAKLTDIIKRGNAVMGFDF